MGFWIALNAQHFCIFTALKKLNKYEAVNPADPVEYG